MREGRWTTVTPSQFTWERDALHHVQQLLPDAEPYRAWSNFTFTADSGHAYEVDLLVATPSGLYLVEIKSLHGRLTSSGSNWILRNHGTRTFDNPYHLADAKAKRLKSLLAKEAPRQGVSDRVPFIQAAVFLSVPGLQVALPAHQLHWVFGPEPASGHAAGALPGIWTHLLGRAVQDPRGRVTPTLSRALPKLLQDVGIARSRKFYQVGSWQLEATPFDTGTTWQDHRAQHKDFAKETRRVRLYLVERNAAEDVRASIAQTARREMLALHGINHPGIVQVDTMDEHDAGPALVFRHHLQAIRLDHYMVQYGDQLEVETRIGMIRQLAEAVDYAHRRRLYHRALSARSVLVSPGRRRGNEPEEAGWLRPQLQIGDWQAATRGPGSSGSGDAIRPVSPSRLGPIVDRSAEAYLAPEAGQADVDPVALDVFGLGALSYLLLSGQAPAASRSELLNRLDGEQGLRPSASADSVSEFMDEVVQASTAGVPARRLATVAEFLEMLELVEEEATAPTAAVEAPLTVEGDLLEAKVGEVISEWEIVRRLGTGSTARAWLATNRLTNAAEVLKVALSDEKIPRLEHEARVLSRLGDSRVIRLVRQEPMRIGNATAIVLAHAGETTVARKLREDGRLTVDELETYSDYLFGVVDYLEGEGVAHRDIKPDNIAIRIRPNRTRQLVLFDFSLAGISVEDIEAGTPRYLDPFLGTATRPIYDEAAERYAVAVTLHEMASGELPAWGDGRTEPRMTEGPPVLAVEAFDPAIRDGLVVFFTRALDREVRRRHRSLKEMRDSWLQVFLSSDSTAPVGSVHPDDESAETTAEERDAAAARANRGTLLEASGLTLRAVSAAHRLEAVTVKDLLGLGSKQLFSLPGLGAKTRQELQGRIKEWRTRLGEDERPTPRTEAAAEIAAAEAAADSTEPELSRIGLDTIAAILVPKLQAKGRNRVEVEGTRLLLGLPNEAGVLPDLQPWPQQPPVAAALGVTSARITQVLSAQRRRWRDEPVVRSLSHDILDLLAESGRVMGTSELAEALLMRRGSAQTGDLRRRAVAMAAVRAAVEIDGLTVERRLLVRRHSDRLMVALEVTPDDGSDTPAAPALLDYADALGRVADKLAAQEVLPGPATVLRELGTVAPKAVQAGISLDDRRMVQLAAVASDNAAATPRLEIYPRDLDPVRALRLAQAGVVPAPVGTAESIGLAPRQVQERVRARFPELADLPGHPHLDRLLAEAGFDLRWRHGRYHPRHVAASASMSTSLRRRSTDSRATVWTADSPELASALRAEQRLVSAAAGGGFRALTVSVRDCLLARAELVRRFDVRPLDVAAAFVAQLRALVAERPKLRWQTVLAADAPHSPDAVRLRPLVDEASRRTGPDLRAAMTRSTPLLLHDAAPLARYGAMSVLYGLADAARDGLGALWLLCPMEDPGHLPRLDGTVVEIPPADEWISLPEAWVTNRHRSGDIAS